MLDQCNAVLAVLPVATLISLQIVLHIVVRLTFNLKPRDHVTSTLRELHWFPAAQRLDYKLRLLVHKALTG